ncbi:hypothetical protein C8F04DRAFT_1198693 [Mycena alexandri]|uniref:Uncharacterized protein n=1 Tax=Mycena alexandri TaxID=1745969 RepID=A0AAD6WLJ1_9AGAR|nr:hypothetical protein C8F04DRAFT_1198693 [Mycena alexandri]
MLTLRRYFSLSPWTGAFLKFAPRFSLRKTIDRMIAQHNKTDAWALKYLPHLQTSFSSTMAATAMLPVDIAAPGGIFILTGIRIQGTQAALRQLVLLNAEQPRPATQHKIQRLRTQASADLAAWHAQQSVFMPLVGQAVHQVGPHDVEHQVLGLPSDFSQEQRESLDLLALAMHELALRQRIAWNCGKGVKHVAVRLQQSSHTRVTQDGGQLQLQRARRMQEIAREEERADWYIEKYLAARAVLLKLTTATPDFPPITRADLIRRKTSAAEGATGSAYYTQATIFSLFL